MERHCCSTHDQDNGRSNSLRHLLDQVNHHLFSPTPLVDNPPLTDDDLLEWLAEIDRSDGSTDGRFVPTNDLDTIGQGSSTSIPAATTKSSLKSSLSPVKEKKKRRDRGALSFCERKRRARANKSIKILKKLVPTSHESDDKAKLLDKTIDHIKQLHEMRKMMSHTFSASRKAVPLNLEVQLGVSFAFQPMAFVSSPMHNTMLMMDMERGSSSNSYTLPFLAFQGSTHPFFYRY